MANDDIIKLGADAAEFIQSINSATKTIEGLNSALKGTRSVSQTFSKVGDSVVAVGAKIEKALDGSTKAIINIKQKFEEIDGNKVATGLDISAVTYKTKASLTELGHAFQDTLSQYILLARSFNVQVNGPNVDKAIERQIGLREAFEKTNRKLVAEGAQPLPQPLDPNKRPFITPKDQTLGQVIAGDNLKNASIKQLEQFAKAERETLELAATLGVKEKELGRIIFDAFSGAEIATTKYLGKERDLYDQLLKLQSLSRDLKILPGVGKPETVDKLFQQQIVPLIPEVDPKKAERSNSVERRNYEKAVSDVKNFLAQYDEVVAQGVLTDFSKALHLDRAKEEIRRQLDGLHVELAKGTDVQKEIDHLKTQLAQLDQVEVGKQLQSRLRQLKLDSNIEFNPEILVQKLNTAINQARSKRDPVGVEVRAELKDIRDAIASGIDPTSVKTRIDALLEQVGRLATPSDRERVTRNLKLIQTALQTGLDKSVIEKEVNDINAKLATLGVGVANLPKNVQALGPLLKDLEKAQQALGTANAKRNPEIRDQIIQRATAGQSAVVDPLRNNPQFATQVNSYNTNLLSIANTADRVNLSLKDIDTVFSAIAANDPSSLILREQQQLYSTINTLNRAYHNLQQAVKEVNDEQIKETRTEKASRLRQIASTQAKSNILPLVTPVSELPVSSFKDVDNYTNAQKRLFDSIDKNIGHQRDFNKAIAGAVESSVYLTLPSHIQEVSKALREVLTLQDRIGENAQSAGAKIFSSLEIQAKKISETKAQATKQEFQTLLQQRFIAPIQSRPLPVVEPEREGKIGLGKEVALAGIRKGLQSLELDEHAVDDALKKIDANDFTNLDGQVGQLISLFLKLKKVEDEASVSAQRLVTENATRLSLERQEKASQLRQIAATQAKSNILPFITPVSQLPVSSFKDIDNYTNAQKRLFDSIDKNITHQRELNKAVSGVVEPSVYLTLPPHIQEVSKALREVLTLQDRIGESAQSSGAKIFSSLEIQAKKISKTRAQATKQQLQTLLEQRFITPIESRPLPVVEPEVGAKIGLGREIALAGIRKGLQNLELDALTVNTALDKIDKNDFTNLNGQVGQLISLFLKLKHVEDEAAASAQRRVTEDTARLSDLQRQGQVTAARLSVQTIVPHPLSSIVQEVGTKGTEALNKSFRDLDTVIVREVKDIIDLDTAVANLRNPNLDQIAILPTNVQNIRKAILQTQDALDRFYATLQKNRKIDVEVDRVKIAAQLADIEVPKQLGGLRIDPKVNTEPLSQLVKKLADVTRANAQLNTDLDTAFSHINTQNLDSIPSHILPIRNAFRAVIDEKKKVNAELDRLDPARATLRERFVSSLPVPTVSPTLRPELIQKYQAEVAKLRDQFNSVGIAETTVISILDTLKTKGNLSVFTENQERQLISAALRVANAVRGIENAAKAKLDLGPEVLARRAQAAAFLQTQAPIPVAKIPEDEAFIKQIVSANHQIIDAFGKSKQSFTDFVTTFNTIRTGGHLQQIPEDAQRAYNGFVKLITITEKAGLSVGSAFDKAIKESTQLYSKLGAGITDVDTIIKHIDATGVVGGARAGLEQLDAALLKTVQAAKIAGKSFTDTRQSILDSVNKVGTEAAEREKQLQEKSERDRQKAAAKRRADDAADVAQINAISPRVLSATVDPRKLNNTLSKASATEIDAINQAQTRLVENIVRGRIEESRYYEILRLVRDTQNRPNPADRRIPSLPPAERAVVQSIQEVDKALGNVKGSAQKAGEALTISFGGIVRLFQAQIIHTAIAQLLQELRDAVTQAGAYQTEIALIQTITQDVSTTFDQWAESIHAVSTALGKSSTEVATAAYESLSNQITQTKEETEAFVLTAGQFGRVTGTSTVDSVNLLSSAINSFGYSAGDAEKIAAEFFATIDLGRIKGSEIANSFGRTSSLARALGVSLREVNAAEIVLTQQGIKSAEAQTQLNNIFIKLLRPTEATKALFKELGVTSGEELVRVEGLGGSLQKVAQAAREGKGDFFEFFNELRGAKGAFTLAQEGGEKFNQALSAIQDSTGKYSAAKLIIDKPVGVQLGKQLQDVKNYITELGVTGAGGIVKLTETIGTLRNALEKVVDITIKLGSALAATFVAAKIVKVAVAVEGLVQSLFLGTAATNALAISLGNAGTKLAGFKLGLLGAGGFVAGFLAVDYFLNSLDRLEEATREHTEKIKSLFTSASELYAREQQRDVEETNKSLEQREKAQLAYFANLRKELNRLGSLQEEISRGIKVTTEGSLSALKDVLRGEEGRLKSEIDDAKKGAETLRNAILSGTEEDDKRQFERKVKLFPQAEVPITYQRVEELESQARDLFQAHKIQEGLKLYKEADSLLQGIQDKFPQIGALMAQAFEESRISRFNTNLSNASQIQQRIIQQQFSQQRGGQGRQSPIFLKNPIRTEFNYLPPVHQELDAAIEKYNQAAHRSQIDTGKEGETSEESIKARKQAYEELLSVQKRLAAAPVQGTNEGVYTNQLTQLDLRINALRRQTASQGISDITNSRELVALEERRIQLFEKFAQLEDQRAARLAVELRGQQELNKEIDLQYEHVFKLLSLKDKQGAIDPKRAAENIARAEKEVNEITNNILNQALEKRQLEQSQGKIPTQSYEELVTQLNKVKSGFEALIESSKKQLSFDNATTSVNKFEQDTLAASNRTKEALKAIDDEIKNISSSFVLATQSASNLFNVVEKTREGNIDNFFGLPNIPSTRDKATEARQERELRRSLPALGADAQEKILGSIVDNKGVTKNTSQEALDALLKYKKAIVEIDKLRVKVGFTRFVDVQSVQLDTSEIEKLRAELKKLKDELAQGADQDRATKIIGRTREIETQLTNPVTTFGAKLDSSITQLNEAAEKDEERRRLIEASKASHEAVRNNRLPFDIGPNTPRRLGPNNTTEVNTPTGPTVVATPIVEEDKVKRDIAKGIGNLTRDIFGSIRSTITSPPVDITEQIQARGPNSSGAGAFFLDDKDAARKEFNDRINAAPNLNNIGQQSKAAADLRKEISTLELDVLHTEANKGNLDSILQKIDQILTKYKELSSQTNLTPRESSLQESTIKYKASLEASPPTTSNDFQDAIDQTSKLLYAFGTTISNVTVQLQSITQGSPQTDTVKSFRGGLINYFAEGGLVPAMLTPGEKVFSPSFTKQNYNALSSLNSFKPIGSDTIPALLENGSFVLNKRAVSLFAQGGPVSKSFIPTVYSTKSSRVSDIDNRSSHINIGDINITHNVPGSTEQSVHKIAQQLQRHIRLGRINLGG